VPIVRYFAEHALESILGEKLGVDLFQDNDRIRAQAEARLHTTISSTKPAAPPAATPEAE
jgi:hypothetical protein